MMLNDFEKDIDPKLLQRDKSFLREKARVTRIFRGAYQRRIDRYDIGYYFDGRE